MMDKPDYKIVKPHQLGYLRRGTDKDGHEIWEKPNGKLLIHNPKRGKLTIAVLKKIPKEV